ncbi:RNase H domain-containing protein [Trichonephila clavata]|uniref:RNase H domain-containing protein n=1 Tax=Trichonephila clavata TaxID=2740835 RepID=A0A8X6GWZ4_TRICU|nr:RNase H domain-containing protein [Trichonephila clavata]
MIWILSDSQSVVQYLDNWRNVSDQRGIEVINKFKTLSMTSVLHLQWIPSHMNLKCNDVTDELAENDTAIPQIKESSASSVNASDFSYFDDHISISSTDDDGEIRKRSISFATANKPFLQEGSPKTQKAKNQEVLGIEKDMDSKKTRSPKSAASKSALNAVTDARPTRTRKPNPKYYGEGMMLYSDE